MPASLVLAAIGAELTGFALAAATFAINFGVSMIITRAFAPKFDTPQAKDGGVRQQIPPNPTNGIPVVYGDAYLGGTFIDAVLTTDQKTMYYVLAITSISPNGQVSFDSTKCYYADRLITFSDYTALTLTDGAGNVDNKINGNLYIGIYTSNANGVITSLNNAPAPHVFMGGSDIAANLRWPSTGRQMYGTMFAIVKLNYNRDAGTTQMQPVTFHVSQYLNNQGAAYPGDVWYDYITNPYYGGAIKTEFVNAASAAALNVYSQATINYIDANGNPATQPRYKINGVLDSGKPVLDNIDKILIACDSWMAYKAVSGEWSIVINKAESSSYGFTDDTIVGNIRVSATDITQSINQIEAQFPSKLNRDQADYVTINTPTPLLYPNEPVNKYSITYDLCNDSVQAQYLANRTLEQAREDLVVIIETTYNGIQIDAGDVVTITNTAYGWNAKPFRVMKVNEVSLPDGNLGASLELNEYNSQVFDDWAINAYQPSPNSDLASPAYFSALYGPTFSGLNQTATVPHFNVNCQLPTTGQATSVTLFYTTSESPSVSDWSVWGTQTASNSQPFTPGTTVTFFDVNIPNNDYYFSYKLSNASFASQLSPLSNVLAWAPNPTSSAVAGTFVAEFTPPIQQVPRTGGTIPVFTGITPQLAGVAAGGAINFVTAQYDDDPAFVPNSWRIGATAATGYGDISASGVTIGNPTDGGNYAQFPAPTAQSTSPATLTVPVRYKDEFDVISQSANAVLQFLFLDPGPTGPSGENGNQSAQVTLYQWNTTTPTNPSGTSQYTWATASNATYTGGGDWSVTLSANPGTPGIQLWTASKRIVASATTTSTIVDWSSGYTVTAIGANGNTGPAGTNGTNGANGISSAIVSVYKWSVTIPSGPIGSSTYTWATGLFTPTPADWSTSPGTSPSQGYTLYQASVSLIDSATVATTLFNWSSASISGIAYTGTNGTSGTDGASARICYSKTTLTSLSSTPATITTSGSSSYPPNDSWGAGTVWQATPPVITAGESVYQSDGIYSPSTGNTVWNVPYLSALKVGQLSAISTNTGDLTVSGYIKSGNSPAVSGTSMTGSGFLVNSDGSAVLGNSSTNINIAPSTGALTLNGKIIIGSANIQNASIATLNLAGNSVTVPSSAYTAGGKSISGVIQTMSVTTTGAPVLCNASGVVYKNAQYDGQFNIYVYRGSTLLYAIGAGTNGVAGVPFASAVLDTPAAGTYTYYISGSANVGCLVYYSCIATLECKR